MNLYDYFKKQPLERLIRIRTNYLVELKILNMVIKSKEEKRSKTKQIKLRGL